MNLWILPLVHGVFQSIDKTVPSWKVRKLAYENTPALCAYRGKISINMVDSDNNTYGANALLNKTCGGDAHIAILGLFNTVLADITYKNKSIHIQSAYEDQIGDITHIASEYFIKAIDYLKTPCTNGNIHKFMEIYDNSYVFTNYKDEKIFVNGNFQFYKNTKDTNNSSISFEYFWDKKNLKSIEIKKDNTTIDVDFKTPENWTNYDAN